MKDNLFKPTIPNFVFNVHDFDPTKANVKLKARSYYRKEVEDASSKLIQGQANVRVIDSIVRATDEQTQHFDNLIDFSKYMYLEGSKKVLLVGDRPVLYSVKANSNIAFIRRGTRDKRLANKIYMFNLTHTAMMGTIDFSSRVDIKVIDADTDEKESEIDLMMNVQCLARVAAILDLNNGEKFKCRR